MIIFYHGLTSHNYIIMLTMFKFIEICSCSYICQRNQKIIINNKYIGSYTYVIVGIGMKNCMSLHPTCTDHMQHDKID